MGAQLKLVVQAGIGLLEGRGKLQIQKFLYLVRTEAYHRIGKNFRYDLQILQGRL